MAEDRRISMFFYKLHELKDWPDRDIITALTNFAKENIGFAQNYADLIVKRLIDPETNTTYKRPLFYLIDSIMKTVGGPFAALFEEYLSGIYSLVLRDIRSEEDIRKLDFLFNTWEERKLLSGNLLSKMKYQLKQQNASTRLPNQAPIQQPITQQQQQFIQQPRPVINSMPIVPGGRIAPQQQFPKQQFPPAVVPQIAPVLTVDKNSLIYHDLLNNEMVNIIQQLYAGMPVNNIMTLEEISIENPSLYTQIRSQADAIAEELLLKRRNNPSSITSNNLNNLSTNLNTSATTRFDPLNRKRPFVDETANFPSKRHGDIAMNSPARGNNHRGFFADQQNFSSAASDSLDRLFLKPGGVGGSGVGVAGHHFPSSSSHMPLSSVQRPIVNANNGPLPAGNFVNGYINETPVVVDVERVQALTSKFASLQNGMIVEMNLPSNITSVASKIVSRLQSYIKELKIPPALPPILFGPLPIEPLYNRPTAQQQKTSSSTKLPVPDFKMADLNNNPERMLKALYADRPYQFHEDGLRFRTFGMLQEHTNAFLERKKVLKKKKENNNNKDIRESREWYCRLGQWISDFNSLTMKSDPSNPTSSSMNNKPSTSAAGSSSNRSGPSGAKSGGGSNSEEFIVPADENFIRCPISREAFATIWDDEEGEMMLRNAVKVLVTEAADPDLFKLAKQIQLEESDREEAIAHIRYMIVHKLIVMDRWLAEGKASTLKDAILRYESLGERGAKMIESLQIAADDEDDEDIFVILEYQWT